MQIKINQHCLATIKTKTMGPASQHFQSHLQEAHTHSFIFVFSGFLQALKIITLIINYIAF